MTERNYTTVAIPVELAKRIEKVLEHLGYQNRSEFVREAARRYLDQVEANLNVKKQE